MQSKFVSFIKSTAVRKGLALILAAGLGAIGVTVTPDAAEALVSIVQTVAQ